MDFYEFDNDVRRRPVGKIVVAVVAVSCIVGIGFVLLRNSANDDGGVATNENSTTEPSATAVAAPTTVAASVDMVDAVSASTTTAENSEPDSSESTPVDSSASNAPTTTRPTSASATTTAPSTTAPSTTSPSTTSEAPGPVVVTYPVLPDGTPAPIVGIFDTDTITLTGVVPSESAKARLEELAVATSKFPEATMISLLTIDATMPLSVGVRVIELNSVRFPENSSTITQSHAEELDRAVGIMNLLDHVSVDVIGHADQRGNADVNFRLSEARAQSVTGYMVANGVAPERLAARAVGADDLLSVGDTDAALALNRRTEFIFYGLLIDP